MQGRHITINYFLKTNGNEIVKVISFTNIINKLPMNQSIQINAKHKILSIEIKGNLNKCHAPGFDVSIM